MGRRPKPDINEIKKLYVDEGLTLQEVGDRVGLTRQGVHERLKCSGIHTRSRKLPHLKSRIPLAPRETPWQLYVVEGLTIKAISDRLDYSPGTAYLMLKKHGIPRRKVIQPRQEIYSSLRNLNLGESTIIDGLNPSSMYVRIYGQGKRNGMKYSVQKLSRSSVRVTRVS